MTKGELFTASEDLPLDQLVQLMERHNVKRLPIMRDDALVGIVTRTDLHRAVASLARDVPDPTADGNHIRSRILSPIQKYRWRPLQLGAKNGQGRASELSRGAQLRCEPAGRTASASGLRVASRNDRHCSLMSADCVHSARGTSDAQGSSAGASPFRQRGCFLTQINQEFLARPYSISINPPQGEIPCRKLLQSCP